MRRLLIVATLLTVASGLGVTAWAAGGGSGGGGGGDAAAAPENPAASISAGDDDERQGIHGGVIARVHAAAGCGLVPTGELPGNWTHGDYVTAVAAVGDPALVVRAAHSRCGMPTHGVGRGGGPPAHALAHIAKASPDGDGAGGS